MGSLRRFKRHLKQDKVYLAEKTQIERIKLMKSIDERIKGNDKDLINAVGENLPPEIKKAAEESIAKSVLPEDPLLTQNALLDNYPSHGIGETHLRKVNNMSIAMCDICGVRPDCGMFNITRICGECYDKWWKKEKLCKESDPSNKEKKLDTKNKPSNYKDDGMQTILSHQNFANNQMMMNSMIIPL